MKTASRIGLEAGREERGGSAGAAVAGTGAAATAAASAACCVPVLSPLVVAVLGASGSAWVAGLKPWAPYLLGAALLLLVYATWSFRRARRCGDSSDEPPAPRLRDRALGFLLGFSWVVWLVSVGAFFFLS